MAIEIGSPFSRTVDGLSEGALRGLEQETQDRVRELQVGAIPVPPVVSPTEATHDAAAGTLVTADSSITSTVTLPPPSNALRGRWVVLRRTDTGSAITVRVRDGSDVDGGATASHTGGATYWCDGTAWWSA